MKKILLFFLISFTVITIFNGCSTTEVSPTSSADSKSITTANIGQYNSFPWNWNMPFAGSTYITQGYGSCPNPYSHTGSIYYALDFDGIDIDYGTEVLAPASGYVEYAAFGTNAAAAPYGYQVIVEAGNTGQGNGNRYLYRVAHLSSVSVQAGWWVEKGQVLGYVGNSGTASTSTHLHFNINRGAYGGSGTITGESFPPSFSSGIDGYAGQCSGTINSEFTE